jgi:hypothetical protein
MKYLGFERLPKSVWKKSILSRNWSKDMICQPATAYDMVNGTDYRCETLTFCELLFCAINFLKCTHLRHTEIMIGHFFRIKVCAQLSEPDFTLAHRLMAQLYTKFSSRRQSLLLRDSPNPSLGQALSGAFAIISMNLEYLKAQVDQ